jgi:DNA ligase-1
MSASFIKQLNEDNGRLHKEDVLKQALTAAKLGNTVSIKFLQGLKLCYNTFVTFGVKQIPESIGITDAENPYNEFFELLTRLSNRELTGNDARDAIAEISERFDSDEWNLFLAPILRRDMRSGISLTTINKICKGTDYEIPVFACQLATNSENRPEMKGVKRLEPKLDGVRVLMVVLPPSGMFDGTVTCYSRNGKIFENFTHIEEQVLKNVRQLVSAADRTVGMSSGILNEGFVFDGEVVGNSFQELMRQARRKENVAAEDSVFHIFDILPLADFKRGHWNAQLYKRIELLRNMQGAIDKMPNAELLPHLRVNLDEHEGRSVFERYCREMVEAGYEGVMIKDLEAPYICKRSTFWMKYKPTITVDLEVIGLEEGTGRNKDRLGALVCHGVDSGKEITVNVGSGFSDSDRDQLWEDRNLIFGRTVEILCDVITQNQDGTYSLRFPRFIRFRDDK